MAFKTFHFAQGLPRTPFFFLLFFKLIFSNWAPIGAIWTQSCAQSRPHFAEITKKLYRMAPEWRPNNLVKFTRLFWYRFGATWVVLLAPGLCLWAPWVPIGLPSPWTLAPIGRPFGPRAKGMGTQGTQGPRGGDQWASKGPNVQGQGAMAPLMGSVLQAYTCTEHAIDTYVDCRHMQKHRSTFMGIARWCFCHYHLKSTP